jgi:hypothetical protein
VHSLRALQFEERNIFQRVLGENVQIERSLHMAGRMEKSGEQRKNLMALGNKMRS